MESDGGDGDLTAYLDYTMFKMMVYQQPVKYIINRKEEEEEEACKATSCPSRNEDKERHSC